ncbi:protein kinase, partial [Patescibacteria group bacterium]|nr:protein kinase [Patescibacteria group bacterium]
MNKSKLMNGFELRNYPDYPQDTYTSKVQTLANLDGTQSLYKESRFRLSKDNVAIAEFLRYLEVNPHPNLLSPEAINAELGQPLIEIYPFIDEPLLSREEATFRDGIRDGKIDESDLIDMMLQLTSALSSIHQLGFVHRDVRAQNIFVRPDDDRLHLTLFDYNSLCRPYFQADALDSWILERPPELRTGNVTVDARFDVYALGYILFDLTHSSYKDELPISTLDPDHPLFAVMSKAKAPLTDCYDDATAMNQELLALAA